MTDRVILYAVELLMLLAAIAILMPTILTRRSDGGAPDAAASDIAEDAKEARANLAQALRDEKARLDGDLARGAVTPALYQSLLADLESRAVAESRELKASEDEAAAYAAKPLRIPRGAFAAAVAAGFAVVSAGLYAQLGAPELMTLQKEQAVMQGTASAESIETYLEESPKDGRAWVLLAHRRIDAGDFMGASQAYRSARAADEKIRQDPDIMLEYGAAVLTAQDKAHYGDAKRVLLQALGLQPENDKAVELVSLAAMATEDWPLAKKQIEFMMTKTPPDSAQYLRFEGTVKKLNELIAESGQAPAP